MENKIVENRRDFLKVSGLGAALVASQGSLFGKTGVMKVENGKHDYPNTNYTEEMYRSEFGYTYGKKEEHGFAYHCVNCQGNCAWEIWSHNGVVTRENQSARYPIVNPKIPDFNPRGCNKGVQHSQVMYEKDRILYPMKRVGARGEGKWKRISWDEAATEVAENIFDCVTDPERGLDKLMVHAGTGLLTEGRRGGPLRFSTQIGAVRIYPSSYLGDMFSGASVAFGEGNLGCTWDFQYTADTVILWGNNPDNTRIPDAHFVWEGKYNGAKVIVITPEFNASARHADLWVPIISGTDNILAMAIMNDIIKNKKYALNSVKTYTDLPFLVRKDNKKLLRTTDLKGHDKDHHEWDEQFYFWNTKTNSVAMAPGAEGNTEHKSIRLKDHGYDIDPALEGTFKVKVHGHDGHEEEIEVTTAFEMLKAEAAKFDPETYKSSTGKNFYETTNVSPSIVTMLADEITTPKNNKVTITTGFALNKYHNGILNIWNIASLCGLGGRYGTRGGLNTENEFSLSGLGVLAGFSGKYAPRFGSGFLGEFMMGDMDKEFDKYFNDEDVKRAYNGTVKDKAEFQAILDEMRDGAYEGKEAGKKPYWLPDTALIVADAKVRRNKAAYNKVWLDRTKFFAYVDYRMSATAQYADILLPAKSHYEVWDLRASPGYHRFVNLAQPAANLKGVGEAKDEWSMFAFLAKAVQDVATRPENIDKAQVPDNGKNVKGKPLARDGVRRLDIFYDEFTNIDEESDENFEPLLGHDEYREDVTGDRLALEAALAETKQFQPHTIEKMYKQGGFLQLNEKAAKNSPLYADRPYNSLENHIFRFERFETVSGRHTFYVDHDLWIKLGVNTNTGREPLAPVDPEKYPFTLMTPHARWSIHSNYKTAKILQRLQRGKPWVMINNKVADVKGIKDGDEVRIYNMLGEFYAMAKVTPNAPLTSLVMEDGWDPNFFRERKHNNVVVPPSLSLIEMSEGWGHLKFGGVWDGNQYAYDGAINVEKA